jgi:hypothetical protein
MQRSAVQIKSFDNYLLMFVHRCARSVEETVTNSRPRSSGRGGSRHPMVDCINGECRGFVDDPASEGALDHPIAFEFKRLAYQAVKRKC